MRKFAAVAVGVVIVVAGVLSGTAAQAEQALHPDIE